MKNKTLKSLMRLSAFMLVLVMAFSACKKDPVPDPDIVEDGYYVYGPATGADKISHLGLMKTTKNEFDQSDRAELYEIYIAAKKDADIHFAGIVGGNSTTYAPGNDFAEVAEADKIGDEPRGWFARGSIVTGEAPFTVPEDGLYHIVYDSEFGVFIIARVEWGVIGGATPDGWGTSTPMPADKFDLNEMNFKVENLILNAGEFKFRYSNGWKIVIEPEVVLVNTNYGESISDLVPGGGNINNENPGIYTVAMKWKLGEKITATLTKTGDYEPPAYPEAMYIVGAATAYGWDEPGTHEDALMHKIAGGGQNDGIFWKICHIAANEGFKLSASKWADPNLGFGSVDQFDAEGLAVSDDGGNMKIDESGMMVVVLDLRDGVKVSVKPAAVYGIGDAFGGWDSGVAANKFTVNNTSKTLVSPALPASGNIRMYAAHSWIPDWWNAEFNVFGTDILYRNDGGDQDAVPGTAGQVITLHFDDNTGSIN